MNFNAPGKSLNSKDTLEDTENLATATTQTNRHASHVRRGAVLVGLRIACEGIASMWDLLPSIHDPRRATTMRSLR